MNKVWERLYKIRGDNTVHAFHSDYEDDAIFNEFLGEGKYWLEDYPVFVTPRNTSFNNTES